MKIKLQSKRLGHHVHTEVFVGPDWDHLALSGTLIMHVGEWQLFGAAMLLATDETAIGRDLEVKVEGDEQVVMPDEKEQRQQALD